MLRPNIQELAYYVLLLCPFEITFTRKVGWTGRPVNLTDGELNDDDNDDDDADDDADYDYDEDNDDGDEMVVLLILEWAKLNDDSNLVLGFDIYLKPSWKLNLCLNFLVWSPSHKTLAFVSQVFHQISCLKSPPNISNSLWLGKLNEVVEASIKVQRGFFEISLNHIPLFPWSWHISL